MLCVCWLQLLHLGLPVARQPRLEAACQGLEQQLLRSQPMTAPAVWLSRHSLSEAISKRHYASMQATSRILPPYGSQAAGWQQHRGSQEPTRLAGAHDAASATGALRGLLQSGRGHHDHASKVEVTEHTQPGMQDVPKQRLHSDHVLHVGIAMHSAPNSGDAGPEACEEWEASGLWAQTDDNVWLQACQEQRGMLEQMGAAPQQGHSLTWRTATSAASSLLQALPSCGSIEWGVVNQVLYEAAEAVASGSDGKLLHDTDPQLPVLQLARSLVGHRAGGGDAGEQAQSSCSYLDGPVSPVDKMQLVLLPAARAWVREHLDGLPALHTGARKVRRHLKHPSA